MLWDKFAVIELLDAHKKKKKPLGQKAQGSSAKIPELIILLPSVILTFSFLLAEAKTLGDIFQHYSQIVHF